MTHLALFVTVGKESDVSTQFDAWVKDEGLCQDSQAGTFSVPLSADGKAPPTMKGACAWLEDHPFELSADVIFFIWEPGGALLKTNSSAEIGKEVWSWDQCLETLGVRLVESVAAKP